MRRFGRFIRSYHRWLWLGLAVFISGLGPVWAQNSAEPPADPQAQAAARNADALADVIRSQVRDIEGMELQSAPVVVNGEVLFRLRPS